MNKIDYIQKVLNECYAETCSSKSIEEIMKLYGLQYVDYVENCDELISKGLIYSSSGKYILSEKADEIIEKAAKMYFEDSGLVLDSQKFQRRKRPITDDMNKYANLVKELLEPNIPIKLIKERRSNLDVKFFKKYKGIGRIEIMNSGILRVTVYKPDEKAFEVFNKEFGMVYRSTDIQTYFDTKLNEENVRKLIELLLKYVGF